MRDYIGEMRALIDSEFHEGDTAPGLADRIVEKLRATDPGLLAGWLDIQAVGLVREAVGRIHRSQRSFARLSVGRQKAGAAASQYEATGDVDVLTPFLSSHHTINDAEQRVSLARMRAPDLIYVASHYEGTAKTARMEAAFFRAMAKRVGNDAVADHFTEDQVASLYRSITGRAA